MSLSWLLSYDLNSKTLNHKVIEENKSKYKTFVEFSKLIESPHFKNLGFTESQICNELIEILRQRLIATLMPSAALFSDPSEEVKPTIRKHLSLYGILDDEPLVNILKTFSQNFRRKVNGLRRKKGVDDLRVSNFAALNQIYDLQNKRCHSCGEPLYFGSNMELDHIIPDHLGNDPDNGGNWRLLCKPCNRGKNEWIHYTSKFGRVATLHSEISDVLLEPVRYASLERDGKCSVCSVTGSGWGSR